MTPVFFTTRAKFRAWLQQHHADTTELWIGFHRAASGKGGLTYREALDEALCFGWIDGVRQRFDDTSYRQRFTPRTLKSYWSAINVKRAEELIKDKRMAPSGLRAFERRDASETARYSFERAEAAFTPGQLKQFRSKRAAWDYFQSQPPYYRRLATFWVVSAKKEETRVRRLATLIGDSAAGRRIGLMASQKSG